MDELNKQSDPARRIIVNLLKTDEYLRYLKTTQLFRQEIEQRLESLPRKKDSLTVFVDEIQKLPLLLDEVHYLIEQYQQKIIFILTGSSARKLKRSGANLLAGRAANERLYPLIPDEVPRFNLDRALQFGTLPVAYLHPKRTLKYLKSYTEVYLREEIVQEATVRRLEPFLQFLDLSSQFDGTAINFAKLSRQIGVSLKTVQGYFEILEETLIAIRVPFWSYSSIKQILQSPKFYLFDTGILNALSGELRTELRPNTYRYGKLFENFLVNYLVRLNSYLQLENKFFHVRTTDGLEIDLIVSRGPSDTPRAIEFKSSVAPNTEDLAALLKFAELQKSFRCYCLCRTPRGYNLGPVRVLPWQQGASEVLKWK